MGQGGKNNQEQVVLLGQGCTKKVRYKDGEQETQELGKGKLWYASCVLCGVWGYLSGSLNLIVRTGQLARTFLTSMCQKKKKKAPEQGELPLAIRKTVDRADQAAWYYLLGVHY